MEIRNVRTFVKAAEFASFTKAARSIGYSQATVTAQIHALEEELGVLLFDRIGRQVFLTDAGRKFLPYAARLLNAELEAAASVRPQAELTGRLRIATASSLASAVLPACLLKFQQAHPGVYLSITISDFIEDTLERLKRDQIDFLAELTDGRDIPGTRTVYDRTERVVFVTAPENPLAVRGRAGLAEITGSSFITTERSMGYCLMLERQLKKLGIEFHPAMENGSAEAILKILTEGFGISFLPEYMVREYLDRGQLTEILPEEETGVDLHFHVMVNENKWIDPVMTEFIRILGEVSEC